MHRAPPVPRWRRLRRVTLLPRRLNCHPPALYRREPCPPRLTSRSCNPGILSRRARWPQTNITWRKRRSSPATDPPPCSISSRRFWRIRRKQPPRLPTRPSMAFEARYESWSRDSPIRACPCGSFHLRSACRPRVGRQFLDGSPLLLARAYLQSAQASFQLGTYTGYVQAAFAAELAQRIAKEKLTRRWGLAALVPVERIIREAARRLWFRLPVLAILLGWFLAGIAAAVVSLPFEAGAAFRAWLLPIWAMGLVCAVLYGFVRSIRSALKRQV